MLSQKLREVLPRKAPRRGLCGNFAVLGSFFEPVLAAFFVPWPSPLLVESLVGPPSLAKTYARAPETMEYMKIASRSDENWSVGDDLAAQTLLKQG